MYIVVLCTGVYCCSVHGCVSAVCMGACERGIMGVGGCVSTGATGRGEHRFV